MKMIKTPTLLFALVCAATSVAAQGSLSMLGVGSAGANAANAAFVSAMQDATICQSCNDNVNIGGVSSGRVIFLVIASDGTTGARTIASATINGVSAGIRLNTTGGSNTACGIISAAVPTGSGVVSVAINFTGGQVARHAIAAWNVTNLISETPVNSSSTSANGGVMAISNTAEGFIIAGSQSNGPSTATWSGANEVAEGGAVSSYSFADLIPSTGVSANVSATWAVSAATASCAASFR